MSYSHLTQGQYSYFIFDRKRLVSRGDESSILSLNPVGKRWHGYFVIVAIILLKLTPKMVKIKVNPYCPEV